jgi:hypothetical protein
LTYRSFQKCCDMSQTVQDGKCVTPPPTPGGGGNGQCPQQPVGICALKAACGNGTSNGLKYGSCYSLVFPDGHQLGRGRNGANNEYIADGYVQSVFSCILATHNGTTIRLLTCFVRLTGIFLSKSASPLRTVVLGQSATPTLSSCRILSEIQVMPLPRLVG